uniref:Uncharacterized protein n=1 Tax=Cryptomonas curvata TaxID=233186 RepID=A0A6T8BUT3_9CRYP|mmetsp:Transcript_52655/g.109882  ORF Transcript_52655/g.109882 Transcript_52655/m.109882 type:complete len:103 (+) Transcript_52655:58-366(+)
MKLKLPSFACCFMCGCQSSQAKKSERTSLAMSMILAVFSPLSFISGIYGMNFTGGTMPELDWTRENSSITGYEYFWILVGVLVAITILLYMAAGLIPGPLSW